MRAPFAAVCLTLLLAGCGERTPPSEEECQAAAQRLVDIFVEHAGEDPVARRAAQRQHKNFLESCTQTGSRAQALCTAQAQTLAELEACE